MSYVFENVNGRPINRCGLILKHREDGLNTELAHCRNKWQNFINTVMNLREPQEQGPGRSIVAYRCKPTRVESRSHRMVS
jgi:hypothetical protein